MSAHVLGHFSTKDDLQKMLILKTLTNYLQSFCFQLVLLFTVLFQRFCCETELISDTRVRPNEMFSSGCNILCFVRNTFLKVYKKTLSTWGSYSLFS